MTQTVQFTIPRRIKPVICTLHKGDLGSTQFNLPDPLRVRIQEWSEEWIPESALTADGREALSHITIKYGLVDTDPAPLKSILSSVPPLSAILQTIRKFEAPDFDVIYIGVESPGLVWLNKLISSKVKCVDTHPGYTPHCTIAYVKKGSCDKLLGSEPFLGNKLLLSTVVFSSKDKCARFIPLRARNIARTMDNASIHAGASPLSKSVLLLRKVATPASLSQEARIPAGSLGGGRWTNTIGRGHEKASDEQVKDARAKGYAVPPSVWGLKLFADPGASIKATWFAANGKQQYLRSVDAVNKSNEDKFGPTMDNFRKQLPAIRARVKHDLTLTEANPNRIKAAIVDLVDQTTQRIGEEIHAAENGTYGISTLRKDHITSITAQTVHFTFVGKDKVVHSVSARGKALCDTIRHLLTLPGPRLFQAAKRGEKLHPITASDVRDYLAAYSITPRNFRTYHATRIAHETLRELGPASDIKIARKNITAAVRASASKLQHTAAMSKQQYIDPRIFDAYIKGHESLAKSAAGEAEFDKRYGHIIASSEADHISMTDPFPDDFLLDEVDKQNDEDAND